MFRRIISKLPARPIQIQMRSLAPPAFNAVRLYSGHPEPLTVQGIEDRVMVLLRDFDKVDASKVPIVLRAVHSLQSL